jgi:hypothetical protein
MSEKLTHRSLSYYAGVFDAKAKIHIHQGVPYVSLWMRGSLPRRIFVLFGGSFHEFDGGGWVRWYGSHTAKLAKRLRKYVRILSDDFGDLAVGETPRRLSVL